MRSRAAGLSAVFVVVLAVAQGCTFVGAEGCARGPDRSLREFRDNADAERLIGLSEAELTKQLGPATSQRFAPEWDRSYWLRPQGFCMDGWYLVVDIDEQGFVTDARVIPD